MKQIRFTKIGYEKLKKDYEELLKSRPAAVEDLKKAREMGDLSENGYYKASRAKLSFIDSRLRRIAFDLKNAAIVAGGNSQAIGIGSNVTLATGDKNIIYQIVGDMEANPSQGTISLLSPLGKALEGKKAEDEVTISTPAGKVVYKINAVT